MKKDIPQIPIPKTEMKKAIGRIFSDCVIIDSENIIVSVGHCICSHLGYLENQFSGKPLSILTGTSFLEKLKKMLSKGFFEEQEAEIFNIEGRSIPCKVSGFYLGFIFDLNGFVILKFWTNLEVESVQKQLNEKKDEMDEFIYSTSHGMRGPLATIKGLINLLKIHTHIDEEHKFIISQMNHFAELLDNRLHKLIYFAESDKAHEFAKEPMPLATIAEKLREHEFTAKSFPEIYFTSNISEPSTALDNASLILALLQNIKAFFCRRSTSNFNLSFNAGSFENFVELEMVGSKILLSEECRKKIDKVNIGYVEILNDPEFTDLYSAKKIAFKLNARMKIQAFGDSMRAHIIIPTEVGSNTWRSSTFSESF